MRAVASVAVLLLAALALPAPAQAVPSLRLSEVHPDPAADGREFIEVWNVGTAPIELAGWQLHDLPTASGSVNRFTFPAWTLAPNARVVVWGGGEPDARGPSWSASAAWNNAGDVVHLVGPQGVLAERVAYGTTAATNSTATSAPNATLAPTTVPKPGKGLSAELHDGAWSVHEPTPAMAPGAVGALMWLEVANAAPVASLGPLPRSVRPAGTLALTPSVADGNGPDDVAAWSLSSQGVQLAGAAGPIPASLAIPAPAQPGAWPLALVVSDRSGATSTATANVTVRWSDLEVALPAEGLRFPAAGPGVDVVTLAPVTLRNDGATPLTPRLDVSPFRGPAAIAPEGHLWVGVQGEDGTEWLPYTGPLTALPAIAAGHEAELHFQFRAIPALPAGSYGTSFTVVAS